MNAPIDTDAIRATVRPAHWTYRPLLDLCDEVDRLRRELYDLKLEREDCPYCCTGTAPEPL